MFGHDKDEDDKKNDDNVIHPVSTKPADEKLMGLEDTAKSSETKASQDTDEDIANIVGDINSTNATDSSDDSGSSDDISSVSDAPDDQSTKKEDSSTAPADITNGGQVPTELLEIKKSALQELSPLIDQLDQSAEEKTNLILMTMQATDDQSLVSSAFGCAKNIKDDKKRAQAMLDIINEINYFTNKKK